MIFVTVGSQAPFDRLVIAVDEWASLHPQYEVLAQIANTSCHPRHMKFTHFMDPPEFARAIADAQVVVGHAGMGTIITALELGKQVVVMPRLAIWRETRNDHQVATAKQFGAQGRIVVAIDEHDLPTRLEHAMIMSETVRICAQASPRLLKSLRGFLAEPPEKPVGETTTIRTPDLDAIKGLSAQKSRSRAY
jgi:UDP-N-acetylglucosamine transferase subunit ALG13